MEEKEKKIGAPRKAGDKKVNAGISTEQKKIDLLGADKVKRICKNAIDANYEHVKLKTELQEVAKNPNQTSIL